MQFDFIPVEGTMDVNVIMRQAWGIFFDLEKECDRIPKKLC